MPVTSWWARRPAPVRVVLRHSQRQRERRPLRRRSPARRTAKRAPDDDPHRVRPGAEPGERAGTELGVHSDAEPPPVVRAESVLRHEEQAAACQSRARRRRSRRVATANRSATMRTWPPARWMLRSSVSDVSFSRADTMWDSPMSTSSAQLMVVTTSRTTPKVAVSGVHRRRAADAAKERRSTRIGSGGPGASCASVSG